MNKIDIQNLEEIITISQQIIDGEKPTVSSRLLKYLRIKLLTEREAKRQGLVLKKNAEPVLYGYFWAGGGPSSRPSTPAMYLMKSFKKKQGAK